MKIYEQRFSLMLVAVVLLTTLSATAGERIKRVEPLFWWTGMENPELQLLV